MCTSIYKIVVAPELTVYVYRYINLYVWIQMEKEKRNI